MTEQASYVGGEAVALHYLGPPGTYSHQVAQKVAARLTKLSGARRISSWPETQRNDSSSGSGRASGSNLKIRYVPSTTIEATVEDARTTAAREGRSALALLPYENSSNGPVTDSFDILFAQQTICVVAEEYLPVRHSLLVSRATQERLQQGAAEKSSGANLLHKLDAVYSHPQALGQCSNFLDRSCRSDLARIETTSTGEAARLIAQEGAARSSDKAEQSDDDALEACISSAICTQRDVYDLVELESDIQDSSDNTTRFLLVEVGDARITDSPAPIQAASSTARAIFRIRSDDGDGDSALTKCLAHVYAAPHQRSFRVRKIDRACAKTSSRDIADRASTSRDERAWPATYLLEVDAQADASNQSDNAENAAVASIYTLAKSLGRIVGPAIEMLGVWAL